MIQLMYFRGGFDIDNYKLFLLYVNECFQNIQSFKLELKNIQQIFVALSKLLLKNNLLLSSCPFGGHHKVQKSVKYDQASVVLLLTNVEFSLGKE